MPLCSKCHRNEATIHITSVFNGVEKEKMHFCQDCSPSTGFEGLTVEEIQSHSIIGKKCEFCGQAAYSGVGSPKTKSTFWCFDCGLEYNHIRAELFRAENPDWKNRVTLSRSFLNTNFPPDEIAQFEARSEKAILLLKERRKQDGRDKAS